jgi:hypothetical protein
MFVTGLLTTKRRGFALDKTNMHLLASAKLPAPLHRQQQHRRQLQTPRQKLTNQCLCTDFVRCYLLPTPSPSLVVLLMLLLLLLPPLVPQPMATVLELV